MPVETNEPIPTVTKKLSEIISAVWSDDEVMSTGVTKSEYRAMYDAARALEERVAELENSQASWDRVVEQQESINAATARAEAAEALATNLDRQCDDLGKELERVEKQLYEACGERDVAEHEVARLREDVALAAGELLVSLPEPGTDMARLLIANSLMRRDRDALRAKLENARKELDGGSWDYQERCRDALRILDGEGDT